MRLEDLKFLIEMFGGETKVKDIAQIIKLINDIENKIKKED